MHAGNRRREGVSDSRQGPGHARLVCPSIIAMLIIYNKSCVARLTDHLDKEATHCFQSLLVCLVKVERTLDALVCTHMLSDLDSHTAPPSVDLYRTVLYVSTLDSSDCLSGPRFDGHAEMDNIALDINPGPRDLNLTKKGDPWKPQSRQTSTRAKDGSP